MKAVVLFSGGLDSTVLLYKVAKEYGWKDVEALSFDYGQKHSVELEKASDIIEAVSGNWECIQIVVENGEYVLPGSSQTEAGIKVPKGHYADESMKATFVPNRNMIMLSIAAGRAIGLGAKEVFYAAHAGDHAIYPDCRPEFLYQINRCVQIGNYPGVFEGIQAPFIGKTKADIVMLGTELGVPFEMTWSCYEGREIHCGECGTCVERKEAFELAGVEDPTEYRK
jgi:7-cyano-7-deazaguanine synthase